MNVRIASPALFVTALVLLSGCSGAEPETVQSVVRAGAGPLAACYKTALAAQPGLAGEVVLRFTVDASGAPQGTQVAKSTLPAGAFQGCVLAAFGALRFPASSAGVLTVQYPLGFAP